MLDFLTNRQAKLSFATPADKAQWEETLRRQRMRMQAELVEGMDYYAYERLCRRHNLEPDVVEWESLFTNWVQQ